MIERRPSSDPTPAHDPLEPLIGRVLREQPPRRAPRELELRVLTEIERRMALPWWRSSFMNWPLPARVVFLLASFGAVKIALAAVMWAMVDPRSAPVVATLAKPLSWAEQAANVFSTLSALGTSIVRAIPPHWLHIGIAVAAALYIALFALSATAYRTLYLNK